MADAALHKRAENKDIVHLNYNTVLQLLPSCRNDIHVVTVIRQGERT